MRAYVAHNMDSNEDLLDNLEMAKSEAATVQVLAEEGVDLLRKPMMRRRRLKLKLVNWLGRKRLWRPRKRRLKKKLSS